jgi:uncharacterized damage-inducible protein DinB
MSMLYRMEDRRLLSAVLTGEGIFLAPAAVLDGLTDDQAHAKSHNRPAVPPDGWEALRTRYLQSVEEAKRIASESDSLGKPLLPPGVEIPVLAKESHGSGLLQAAVHSGHHLGQIITMRQMMGLWPPPGGTMTC